MHNDQETLILTMQRGKNLIFTVKFNILSSKMAKLTSNDPKMSYFEPFCPIFDQVKGRNVIVDPTDG
jgi:hypothetical protein